VLPDDLRVVQVAGLDDDDLAKRCSFGDCLYPIICHNPCSRTVITSSSTFKMNLSPAPLAELVASVAGCNSAFQLLELLMKFCRDQAADSVCNVP
jgi:hypothetical protein